MAIRDDHTINPSPKNLWARAKSTDYNTYNKHRHAINNLRIKGFFNNQAFFLEKNNVYFSRNFNREKATISNYVLQNIMKKKSESIGVLYGFIHKLR